MQLCSRTVLQLGLLAIPLSLTVGCSTRPQADYSKLGLVEVAGVITLDGQPVPRAAIFFYQDNGSYSYGITDDAGHYVAMFNSEKSGVVPGSKQVEISTAHSPVPGGLVDADGVAAREATTKEEDPDRPAQRKRKSEKIPACYNAKGVLKVHIERTDRRVDFDLKSDCSTTGPS